jgi:DNA-binding NtrC family response regulator
MGWTDAHPGDGKSQDTPILILSGDPVAGALLGALIETFSYRVQFARTAEHVSDAIRRVRPQVCLVACDNPAACNDEVLGRAAMRSIAVVLFGTAAALGCVRELITEHQIETLIMPPDLSKLEATLSRAAQRLT